MLLAGRESLDGEADSSCGREKDTEVRATAVAQWTTGGARVAVEQLELAVEAGSHRGAYTLAMLLLNGLGGITVHGRSSAGTCVRGLYIVYNYDLWTAHTREILSKTIFCGACCTSCPDKLRFCLRACERRGV